MSAVKKKKIDNRKVLKLRDSLRLFIIGMTWDPFLVGFKSSAVVWL